MLIQGERINVIDVQPFVDAIFEDSEHAKRKRSIANAVLGVINSASLIVYRIGNGLAAAKDLFGKDKAQPGSMIEALRWGVRLAKMDRG